MADRGFPYLRWAFVTLVFCVGLMANTRILDVPLALSGDAGSEFTRHIRVLSPGRLVVEVLLAAHVRGRAPLSASIERPDHSEAARKEAAGSFRLEYQVTEPEIDRFVSESKLLWTVKVMQGANPSGEASGRIRITVPATTRNLVDTQFTLLGLGNAQEIPFIVPGPGKIQISTSWETDSSSTGVVQAVPLTLSLSHHGLLKTFARRQGNGPLRAEHQVTETELDAGTRWVGRIQNDSQAKVKGHFQVTFTPSL